MGLKPGYKQTDVGVIPEEWKVSTVGREFDIKLGKMLDAEKNVGVLKPYIGNKAVQWDRIEISDLPTVPMSRADIERYRLQVGDLLVCEGGEVGRAAIWDSPIEECYYQKALHRLRPLRGFDSRLMVALLRLWSKQGRLANYVTQTSIAHLPREKFLEVPMPVPPFSEQRAIAGALSDVDALLGGLAKLIAKKRDIKQAAMQQLLTGQTRLPGFSKALTSRRTRLGQLPEDWHLTPLKSISTMNGRIGWQGLKQEEFTFVDSDPFLITGMNFEHGEIRWDEVYHIPEERYEEAKPIQLRSGDILMTKDGTIGKILFVETIPFPCKASLNSHLLVFRPLKGSYVPKFLFYQLNSKRFADYVDLNKSGTTFFGITQEAVGNYPACLPSIDEQTAIAAVLSDMDAELAALEQRLAKTRALKQGMMQELLTGRTRIV